MVRRPVNPDSSSGRPSPGATVPQPTAPSFPSSAPEPSESSTPHPPEVKSSKTGLSNWDPNAVLRGAQLTLVGAFRALQNPDLFQSAHYSQAVKAVLIGVVIRLLISTPILLVRFVLFIIGFGVDLNKATWDDRLLSSLNFLEHQVLQLPLFLMSLMRYIVPTLDDMFMLSLAWVDSTYRAKHPTLQTTDPAVPPRQFHKTLAALRPHDQPPPTAAGTINKETLRKNSPLKKFLLRSIKKAAISLGVYLLTFVPYVGPLVLPASAFYSLQGTAGPLPAALFFVLSAALLPKRITVRLLGAYFSSRSLVRDLLEPYFSRLPFTPAQKRRWFRDREGLLFGFGVGFLLLVRIPLVGVLIYGVAEASSAYLITKITEPVPDDRAELARWCERETKWRNKKEFLRVPVGLLDWLEEVRGEIGLAKKGGSAAATAGGGDASSWTTGGVGAAEGQAEGMKMSGSW